MSAGPVRLLNLMRAREDRAAEVEQIALAMIARSESVGCCIRGELLRDLRDPDELAVLWHFVSEEQLEQFLREDWRNDALEKLPELIELDVRRQIFEAVVAPTATS